MESMYYVISDSLPCGHYRSVTVHRGYWSSVLTRKEECQIKSNTSTPCGLIPTASANLRNLKDTEATTHFQTSCTFCDDSHTRTNQ